LRATSAATIVCAACTPACEASSWAAADSLARRLRPKKSSSQLAVKPAS
jgi:hypothetical protein